MEQLTETIGGNKMKDCEPELVGLYAFCRCKACSEYWDDEGDDDDDDDWEFDDE